MKRLVIVFLFAFSLGYSQESIENSNSYSKYKHALELFSDGEYLASQKILEDLKDTNRLTTLQSDIVYFIAISASKLNQTNSEKLVNQFIVNHKESPFINSAYLQLGTLYFNKSKYKDALKSFKKVQVSSISKDERDVYYYEYAYSYFKTDNLKSAERYFKRVENSKRFGKDASYFLGFISYKQDDYKDALKYFSKIEKEAKYASKLSYYKADINFTLGNYQEAIDEAKTQLKQNRRDEVSDLSKIIGESYFQLGQYKEATPYLLNYKGKKRKWSKTDYYLLGYCYYKNSEYVLAIDQFNKIVNAKDELAQTAYYYLAECYIKQNKKQEALNAFRITSEMNFNKKIQEDAYLNYAKLSYEIGNPYESVSEVLNKFKAKYPNSKSQYKISELLISSYLSSRNYSDVINLLEQNLGSANNKKIYQQVCFIHAVELFNEVDLEEASKYFKIVSEIDSDLELRDRAIYWLAEINFKDRRFNRALNGYKSFESNATAENLPEYKNLNYNLGYSYFKLKEYNKAILKFEKYILSNPEDATRLKDAMLRLADVYFVDTQYKNALKFYKDVGKLLEDNNDYPIFQSYMCLGYLGDISLKIKGLESFKSNYPESMLADDAYYDLGNSYLKIGETNKAIKTHELLLEKFPKSAFASKTLLRQGLAYYNLNNNTKALVKLKSLAETYNGTEEAYQAIKTIKLIYIDNGNISEFGKWANTLDYVDISDSELDDASYMSAEKQYLEGNFEQAIKLFNVYIANYPNGKYVLKSHYYLSELYFSSELFENAIPHLEFVVNTDGNEYVETSLFKMSEIYLKGNESEKSIDILKRLEAVSSNSNNLVYAQSNLMNLYYLNKNYTFSKEYAKSVLLNESLGEKVASDAKLILARVFFEDKDYENSKFYYNEIKGTSIKATAAEANYYLASFEYDKNEFENSNTTIQELIQKYSSQKYFCGKGLILMAKNFIALKDDFQASYILENVKTNFSNYEDLKLEAEDLLLQFKDTEEEQEDVKDESINN